MVKFFYGSCGNICQRNLTVNEVTPVCRALVMMWQFMVLCRTTGWWGLYAGADAWGQAKQSNAATGLPLMSGRSLATLVEYYLTVEDRAQAESFLQAILGHPNARLDRMSRLLQESRPTRLLRWACFRISRFGFADEPYRMGCSCLRPMILRWPCRWCSVCMVPGLRVILFGAMGHAVGRVAYSCLSDVHGGDVLDPAERRINALATIKKVRTQYRIDPDRIYLPGMSNVGIGAWMIRMHHADLTEPEHDE